MQQSRYRSSSKSDSDLDDVEEEESQDVLYPQYGALPLMTTTDVAENYEESGDHDYENGGRPKKRRKLRKKGAQKSHETSDNSNTDKEKTARTETSSSSNSHRNKKNETKTRKEVEENLFSSEESQIICEEEDDDELIPVVSQSGATAYNKREKPRSNSVINLVSQTDEEDDDDEGVPVSPPRRRARLTKKSNNTSRETKNSGTATSPATRQKPLTQVVSGLNEISDENGDEDSIEDSQDTAFGIFQNTLHSPRTTKHDPNKKRRTKRQNEERDFAKKIGIKRPKVGPSKEDIETREPFRLANVKHPVPYDSVIFKDPVYFALYFIFGYSKFQGIQEDVIRANLEGKDIFFVAPTGGGKSLCFQVREAF